MTHRIEPSPSPKSNHLPPTHSRWKDWQVNARLLIPGMNTYEVIKHFKELTGSQLPSEKAAAAAAESNPLLEHTLTPVEKLKSYSSETGYSKWEARALALPFIGNAMILYKMVKSEFKEHAQVAQKTLSPKLEDELVKSFNSGVVSDKINVNDLNGTRIGKGLCAWEENNAKAAEIDPSKRRNWRKDDDIKTAVTELISKDKAGKSQCIKELVKAIQPLVDDELGREGPEALKELIKWLRECTLSEVSESDIEMAILDAGWKNIEGISVETRWKFHAESQPGGSKEADVMHAFRCLASEKDPAKLIAKGEADFSAIARQQNLCKGFDEKANAILLARNEKGVAREDMGAVMRKMQEEGTFNDFINAVAKMKDPPSSEFFHIHGAAIVNSNPHPPSSPDAKAPLNIIQDWVSIELKSKNTEDAINKTNFICNLLERCSLTPKDIGVFLKELEKDIDILKGEFNNPEKSLQAFRAISKALIAFNTFKYENLKEIKKNADGNYGNELTPEDRIKLMKLFKDTQEAIKNYKEGLERNDELMKNHIQKIGERLSSPSDEVGILFFRSFNKLKSSFNIIDYKKFANLIKQHPNDIIKTINGNGTDYSAVRDKITDILFQIPIEDRKIFIQNVINTLLTEGLEGFKGDLKIVMQFLKECYNTDVNGKPLQDDSNPFDAWAEKCCAQALQLVGEPRKSPSPEMPSAEKPSETERSTQVGAKPPSLLGSAALSRTQTTKTVTPAIPSIEEIEIPSSETIRKDIENVNNDIELLKEMVKRPITIGVEQALAFSLYKVINKIIKNEQAFEDLSSILTSKEIEELKNHIRTLKEYSTHENHEKILQEAFDYEKKIQKVFAEVFTILEIYINSPDASLEYILQISNSIDMHVVSQLDHNLGDITKEFNREDNDTIKINDRVKEGTNELREEFTRIEKQIQDALETNRSREKVLKKEIANMKDVENKRKKENNLREIQEEINKLNEDSKSLMNAKRLLDDHITEIKKFISIDPQQKEQALLELKEEREARERAVKVAKQILNGETLKFFSNLAEKAKEKINLEYEEGRKKYFTELCNTGFNDHIRIHQQDIKNKKRRVDEKLKQLEEEQAAKQASEDLGDIPGLHASKEANPASPQQEFLKKQSND